MSGLNTPLTPLRFLERAVEVHPDKPAIIDGVRTLTYAQFAARAQQLAAAFRSVTTTGPVAYLAENSVELVIAHFAAPLSGLPLVAINTRLAPEEVRYICDHSQATVLLGDTKLLAPLVNTPLQTVLHRIELPGEDGAFFDIPGAQRYDEFLSSAEICERPWEVDDEDAVISINYTSGTTGKPKGVMYTHRGAYLNALGGVLHNQYCSSTRYLWTLPMFHCNGWCNTWAVTAAMGTHVILRAVRAPRMWELIDNQRITHLSGAPTVLTTLATADEAHPLTRPLRITVAGAPPSPATISQIVALNAELTHVYGLTESYGPYAICETQPQWDQLPTEQRSALTARQGFGMLTSDRMRVVRREPTGDGALVDVESDGAEVGEVVMRGNNVMKGYLHDPETTAEAFRGGWFHTGDLGVMHADGYVQLLDRAKDIIISGGENISTIEVEQALMSHPDVLEVAVIGVPDSKWGERPKAFVVSRPGSEPTQGELVAHVRSRIAAFKAPRTIVFLAALPKTATGKTRKNELRDREWSSEVRING